MSRVPALLGCAVLLWAPRPAPAGGLDIDMHSPRAVGRAGTTTVSGDGGASLLINPAGLARRGEDRAEIGVLVRDDGSRFEQPNAEAENSPGISDRSPATASALTAVSRALSDRLVIALVVVESGRLERRTAEPEIGQPDDDVERLFPHRYGGLALSYQRRTVAAGAAYRANDWLGLGATLGFSDVELAEKRRLWAGFAGRDTLGAANRDLDLVVAGRDRLVPEASVGVLIAPLDWPVELAAAATWKSDVYAHGAAQLGRTRNETYPQPLENAASSQVHLGGTSVLRAGARYLGQRISVEIGSELYWLPKDGREPMWRVRGLSVADQTGQTAEITRVDSLLSETPRMSGRGAVDWAAVPGLLWLSAGYAISTASTGKRRMSPVFGNSTGHTVAIGAEAAWDGVTLSLGYARTLFSAVRVTDEETRVDMLNPFDAGSAPAGAGRHERSRDLLGLSMEVAWF